MNETSEDLLQYDWVLNFMLNSNFDVISPGWLSG